MAVETPTDAESPDQSSEFSSAAEVPDLKAELDHAMNNGFKDDTEVGAHIAAIDLRRKSTKENRVGEARQKLDAAYDQDTLQVMATVEDHGHDAKAAQLAETKAAVTKANRYRKARTQELGEKKAEDVLKEHQDRSEVIAAAYDQAKAEKNRVQDEGQAEVMAYAEKPLRDLAAPLGESEVADTLKRQAAEKGEAAGRAHAEEQERHSASKQALATETLQKVSAAVQNEAGSTTHIPEMVVPEVTTALQRLAEPFYAHETGGVRGGRIMELFYKTGYDKDTVIIERRNIKTGDLVSFNVAHEKGAIEVTARNESLLGRFRKLLGRDTDLEGPSKSLETRLEAIREADKEERATATGRTGLKELIDTSAGTDHIYSHVRESGGDFEAVRSRVQRRRKHRRGLMAWLLG